MHFEGAMVTGSPHYRSANSLAKKGRKLPFETIRGPQTGMLPRLDLQGAQGAFKDSMIHFCNSHYLSQFAAFFIDGRTKRSVAKSCFLVKKLNFFFHSTPRSSKVFWCKKCRPPFQQRTRGPRCWTANRCNRVKRG